ncbi:hypothetical protein GCM10022214_68850 [Actinomadura miaoliensis]|uniref:OmpR/PhoB-type domain-containing protein n=1 Tax=Actinomadura miaoliensis TaxID=430685 RepID=A0ABP7WT92_9ACTN
MRFAILGPLEVTADGRSLPLSAAKHRVLLASLLVEANQPVPVTRLVERLWGDAPPQYGKGTLQTYVMRLRRILNPHAPSGHDVIRTGADGYLVDIAPDALDLNRFEALRRQGRAASRRGDLSGEAGHLAEALSLWRGPALMDVPSESLQREEAPRLTELWLQTVERRVDVDLALGRHSLVVGELRRLTGAYGLRERFWEQLMLALFHCGRQAEALTAYREVSEKLRWELGVDPGERLRRIHQAILDNDRDLLPGARTTAVTCEHAPAPPWKAICQLPPDIGGFTGRAELLEQITTSLTGQGTDTAVPIVAVSGMPGAGKTALAVRVAHSLRSRFPDGQWYVRMEGSGPAPRDPAEVLAEVLEAAGIPRGEVPASLEGRACMLRAHLADRRVLLVVDDVRDTGQIRPLLPGTPGCAVLATSRRDQSALSRCTAHGISPSTSWARVRPRRCSPAFSARNGPAGSGVRSPGSRGSAPAFPSPCASPRPICPDVPSRASRSTWPTWRAQDRSTGWCCAATRPSRCAPPSTFRTRRCPRTPGACSGRWGWRRRAPAPRRPPPRSSRSPSGGPGCCSPIWPRPTWCSPCPANGTGCTTCSVSTPSKRPGPRTPRRTAPPPCAGTSRGSTRSARQGTRRARARRAPPASTRPAVPRSSGRRCRGRTQAGGRRTP